MLFHCKTGTNFHYVHNHTSSSVKMKPQREWFLHVPWGKMNLKSFGHPDGEPVFLVHGRQDSLSVFDPLIHLMSPQYYYVALDMPGNGLSDAFPHVTDVPLRKHELSYTLVFDRPPRPGRPFINHTKFSQSLIYRGKEPRGGPKLQRFHFLYAMELAILHLGWDKFIFMGHSMGCEQGLFFNVIYPGRITRMILLDAGPTLMRMQVEDNEEYQRTFFDNYYDNYKRECFSRKKYSYMLAKQAIMRVRELTEAQCAHILSRNFKELGVKYGSLKQLPSGYSIEAGGPNNGPNSKTGEAADNVTKAEIKNKAQKAIKEDYEAQNEFEAAKEYEAHTLDSALNEYYQRQISNEPTVCHSFVEGRKVKTARKGNEALNSIRARKAIEVQNLIREENENTARNAFEARNANDAQNADEPLDAVEPRNANNADGVEIPEAENFIRFIERKHNDDATGGIYRSCPNLEMKQLDGAGAHSKNITRIGYHQHHNSNGLSANAEDARKVEHSGKAEDAGNADDAQMADDVEHQLGPDSFIKYLERMRNDDEAGYLSWDNRLKNLAPQNYGNDYYFELFKKIPPTLLIAASNGAKNVPPIPKWRQGAKELLDKMATLENFQRVDVEGSHDVHYTHPERVLPYINAFLKDCKISSKL